jgi:hypothetical protein
MSHKIESRDSTDIYTPGIIAVSFTVVNIGGNNPTVHQQNNYQCLSGWTDLVYTYNGLLVSLRKE